jgi:hypothetical protein
VYMLVVSSTTRSNYYENGVFHSDSNA